MIKSLYVRVVVVFIGAVVSGTMLSFFAASWLFKDQLNENLQIPLRYFAEDVARIYEVLPIAEAEQYINNMQQLQSYQLHIFAENGQRKFPQSSLPNNELAITKEQVTAVLAGEIVQVNPTGISTVLLGIPHVDTQGNKQAIFVQPIGPPSSPFITKWILNFLIYSLVIGSSIIMIAAMFLVKPIQRLTQATKHLAEGDFNVKLNIKQGGELGTLARSFDEMTNDLQRLEQLRREFVANVSHEIQSPLTSITGYAVALQSMQLADPERHRYLEIIIAEANRMSKMSDSLLKLSMLESQTHLLQLTTFQLDEQIRRTIVALQPQWTSRQITFHLELLEITVNADYDLLQQVWMNVIGNSMKFSPDYSVITITMELQRQQVVITIADQGVGIDPVDKERIFERFFKVDRAHSGTYNGSGLGLAIVHQIVMLHQGEITVVSERERGTTFVITLPCE